MAGHAGDDKEFYYLNELIEKFSLERVNKSGAIFNVEKLDWLNAEHLRTMPNSELLILLKEEIQKSKYKDQNYFDEYLIKVIDAMKDRVSFVKEYIEKSPYFFEAPTSFEEDTVKKRWKEDSADLLKKLSVKYSLLNNPQKEDYEIALKSTAEELQVGNGKLIHPLRLAVSGMGSGPGVFDIVYIIGKDETLNRINYAIETIKK